MDWREQLEDAIKRGTRSEGWPYVADEMARWLLAASQTIKAQESTITIDNLGRVTIKPILEPNL